MRTLLRGSLGRSLQAMPEVDRLAAAWPVACGKMLAERGFITGYFEGVVRVEVEGGSWLQQMKSMERQLAGDVGRIAGVRVSEIHFELKGSLRR